MHNRVWRKSFHKRKLWKEISMLDKLQYYMKPFVLHLLDVWLQPLPFPTLIKFIYSMVVIALIFLPILYPISVVLIYYALLQYNIEISLNTRYETNLDLIHPVCDMFTSELINDKYSLFLSLYIERWRFLATAIASFIDQVRLITGLLMD